ncbi:hypothetical protein Cgig2_030588 [Carnegiea gigantea]|uniref:RING-type E3 ubiquitin transferase n=1 Tax=Carnegiea gigantea TaxID=171969 RepID=A0A9Q1JNM2_9CARY|nr:hypothetical protein Cgig2_030588 [Carnegiea gigantea]
MLQKSDPDGRWILKFPAVRPCEDVSPATLIASLINLSRSIIAYKAKFFSSQKRICRELIRQTEILLIFFEEIRDCGLGISKTLNLCLSELHFALQKVRFLLQDCTRDGCRFYTLMKSCFVANEFSVVVRSVAMALDIVTVQLGSLQVSQEVRELVELLAKQTQKVKIETDPNELSVMDTVRLILDQFEHQFGPVRGTVKWALGYLGIHTWGQCNMEVKFLEEEISNAEEEEEDREICMLSSLLGFLCYCRGVVFDTLDKSQENINRTDARELLRCLNPEDFRCPISLEFISDPVTTSTGHTYDRLSIQKWLKAGHMLCPKTGEKLISTELVPNLALKKLIQQFYYDNRISTAKSGAKNKDSSRKTTFPSPAFKGAMKILAQFLAGRLTYGTYEQQNKAAYEIRLLAKSNVFNRSVIIDMGNVAPLLDLLTSRDAETQENAIAALSKLSKHPKGQKDIMKQGGLMLLISVLKGGLKMESRQSAAATIFYLSSVDGYRRMIGSTREGISALIELIKDGTLCGKKNALAAIFGLLVYNGNHERAFEAGIVPLLVDLIACTERSDLLADSLVVLDALAEKIDGSIAILQTPALPLIMGLVKSSISRVAKEYCVSILLSLCCNGGAEVIGVLAKESAIMPTLYSLIADGTSHACKKALRLINMLQKFHGSSSSSIAVASKLRKERIVRSYESEEDIEAALRDAGANGQPMEKPFRPHLLLQRSLAHATAMQDCRAWNSSVDRPFSYFPIYRKLICKDFTEFAGSKLWVLYNLSSFKGLK